MPLSRPINWALLKEAVAVFGVVLTNHNHQWSDTERKLWERASTAAEGRVANLPLFKDCIEVLGLAMANHHHTWSDAERRLWERSWAEIRYHQNKQGEDTTHAGRTAVNRYARRQTA